MDKLLNTRYSCSGLRIRHTIVCMGYWEKATVESYSNGQKYYFLHVLKVVYTVLNFSERFGIYLAYSCFEGFRLMASVSYMSQSNHCK